MDNLSRQRFLYHAHAIGFSGHIRRPFHEIIDAQASVALPGAGGFARASVRHFNHKGIFRFDAAHTLVTGSAGADGFDTLISATMENLNILGHVTADRVVAHMTTHHPKDGSQPEILPLGSHYVGLRIAGTPVEPDLNAEIFCKRQNYDGLCADLGKEANGRTYATALARLPEIPGVERLSPNSVRIPQFGTLHVAEFVYSPFARHLIMMRVELGCPMEGDSTICEAGGNGSEYPPD